jgi:hypothetical protein
VPALLYALRVANRNLGPTDSLENRIEKAYGDLEILASYPSLVPLPPSVSNDTTKHKEKAYARSLQYRVSEVWRRAVLQASPRVMDGSPPEGGWRRLSIIHMTISIEICSPQLLICVASRRIRHTTCFGFALKIRTSSLRRNPDPMECASSPKP